LKSLGSYEYVLDSTAFYLGLSFLSFTKSYTTSLVFGEVRHLKSSYSLLETLVETGHLIIVDPDEEHVTRVLAVAIKSGDTVKLSKSDLSVLALAYQLKKPLISDDFSVENIAGLLGISLLPIGTSGIKYTRKWISYCRTCGKGYDSYFTECLICGNKLKRRFKNTAPF
jgi:endoribonuclease Nob1